MGKNKLDTVDMYGENKRDLFKNRHPVIRLLEEIPEIIFSDSGQDLPASCISLKELFSRDNMDRYHVNSRRLIALAARIVMIFDQLEARGICPGLYDLADFYTDPADEEYQVWLCHPERFQLLEYEQDYEWYPEDERILGDMVLLNRDAQRKADSRLLYKVLTGSTRGNVKLPPKMTEADYSDLFYQRLTPELKEYFKEGCTDRDRLGDLLREAWEALVLKEKEEKSLGQSRNQAAGGKRSAARRAPEPAMKMQCMYVLLRTDTVRSDKIACMLYNIQDALEIQCGMARCSLSQSFVYGDGSIGVRKMHEDPPGFRVQLPNKIRPYAAGEALIIAADYYEELLQTEQDRKTDHCCIILFDGALQNSPLFQCGMKKMEDLKEKGVRFYLISGKFYAGEACQRLLGLAARPEDHYIERSV